MEKVICIHQPDFLPYLGFFDRLIQSDTFVILDNVQFLRRGWHHRDKLKTPQGIQWLTVPIQKKGHYSQSIKDTQIDNTLDWKRKHLMMIEHNYRKSPYFEAFFEELQQIYHKPFTYLIDLNLELLEWLFQIFRISSHTILASSTEITSSSSSRLIELVQYCHGTTYFSGPGAKAYLDEELFTRHNLTVHWQEFTHPVYPQLHGPFIANLSVLDCLLNCGPLCKDILRRK